VPADSGKKEKGYLRQFGLEKEKTVMRFNPMSKKRGSTLWGGDESGPTLRADSEREARFRVLRSGPSREMVAKGGY